MPQDTPPSPPKSDPRALVAHAFYAAAIWGLVAYSLWGPKPQKGEAFAVATACER